MFYVLPRKSVLSGKEMDFATPHMQRPTAWKHATTVNEKASEQFSMCVTKAVTATDFRATLRG